MEVYSDYKQYSGYQNIVSLEEETKELFLAHFNSDREKNDSNYISLDEAYHILFLTKLEIIKYWRVPTPSRVKSELIWEYVEKEFEKLRIPNHVLTGIAEDVDKVAGKTIAMEYSDKIKDAIANMTNRN